MTCLPQLIKIGQLSKLQTGSMNCMFSIQKVLMCDDFIGCLCFVAVNAGGSE